jgi:hypothetical protein
MCQTGEPVAVHRRLAINRGGHLRASYKRATSCLPNGGIWVAGSSARVRAMHVEFLSFPSLRNGVQTGSKLAGIRPRGPIGVRIARH